MIVGKLDRRIIIQSATTSQDASGQEIETWTTLATVWASRRDVRGTERFEAFREIAFRTATYRIRWRSGIDETMRIVDEGTTYRVTGIASDRRRGWMELTVEALDPEPSGS